MNPSENVYVFHSQMIFDWAPPFHHYGRSNGLSVFTVCGYQVKSAQGWVADALPLRHAEKFARPCERCFPNGRVT